MLLTRKCVLFLVFTLILSIQPLVAFGCSTCGCSELCPLTMMQDTESGANSCGLLSESIWGSLILKIAYARDPVLQKFLKHRNGVNAVTAGSISGAIGGTFAQNIISVATINPPPGQYDSYLPGSLGLGMSGLVNVAFDAAVFANWRLNKKIKNRQLVVRGQVESILNHLEHSGASCPHAQSDLAEIIGERAACDCLKLWQSSHATVAASKDKTLSDASGQDKNNATTNSVNN